MLEKLKKLNEKSPLELEVWEIDSLMQIALEQAKKIERYEIVLKGISLNEDNASNHLWAKEVLEDEKLRTAKERENEG